ncbi:DUF2489 domain-containing protein [Pseudoalteromonas denitrificans]|uniref:DUF2489 domain-containing protein n=1 Tax=Pseudoalteromonas denitrificans DSM 6059 TaxID=1123010 RepID=A0A1I1QLL3_9GAMM|nr:DUF2489 domain-containing protein [Pseudoalteromonas denitrificans]SFD22925.1 Protein of unknown function [Pseudoalteromonas denitrificans DSM 6059]
MSTFWLIAFIFGALFIAGLAFYAGTLLRQVKQQKDQILAHNTKRQIQQEQKNTKLADSINLIAKAMKEKQCEYSEGCLRVWVLLSQYVFESENNIELEYPGILKMYDVVKEMPTHAARKKYSKKEIYKMDSARWKAEKDLEDEIQKDLDKIVLQFKADPNAKTITL